LFVAFPDFLNAAMRLTLRTTLLLYVLNQKHMLPKPLSSVVSSALFWPTMPITVSRRIGKWISEVDDVVVIGGAPFGFCNIPQRLVRDFRVNAVVNMCAEYGGPVKQYEKLGVEQRRYKVIDHFEPSVKDLKSIVLFLRENEVNGKRVYVHCRSVPFILP